ncbi:hypothetical protein [Peredibacter starrii]|uniref:Uncharacterized protein n=1 Tax=Peredibacter starrii TaxID=28202 RepID=A0AAX4HTK0_9BACT|nr:hypothetical protein [Peredibacter starrii]WPU66644.1 hypothetical protein SOO65_07790 [Peredibacter starrii]
MKRLIVVFILALSSLSSFAAVCPSENSASQALWSKFTGIYSETVKQTPRGDVLVKYIGSLRMTYFRGQVPAEVGIAVAQDAKSFDEMVLGLYAQSSNHASNLQSNLISLGDCIKGIRPSCSSAFSRVEDHAYMTFASLREVVDSGHYARHRYNDFAVILNQVIQNGRVFPEEASSDAMNGGAHFYFSGRSKDAWLAEQLSIRQSLDAELTNCLK